MTDQQIHNLTTTAIAEIHAALTALHGANNPDRDEAYRALDTACQRLVRAGINANRAMDALYYRLREARQHEGSHAIMTDASQEEAWGSKWERRTPGHREVSATLYSNTVAGKNQGRRGS